MIPLAMTLYRPDVATADAPVEVVMDEAAFLAFYQRTARPLRAYLRRSLGNPTLADDLLQESYLRLLRSGLDPEDEAHRRNYLFRIATNLMRDHFRRRRPEAEIVHDPATDHDLDHEIHVRRDVSAALGDLAPRDRQMLWLAYVEGSDHCEIAQVMGLKSSSVKSMLFRARSRMAQALTSRGFRPGGAT
jgi:RNA polymerase sigma-70 factor (ECF subfamily)